MVVYDFDFRRAFRRPNEADPELVVDSDRMSPLPITRQDFKTIAWRRPQVAQVACGVEVAQLPSRRLDQISRKALRVFAVEDGLGGLIPEVLITRQDVSLNDTAVKFRAYDRQLAPLLHRPQ